MDHNSSLHYLSCLKGCETRDLDWYFWINSKINITDVYLNHACYVINKLRRVSDCALPGPHRLWRPQQHLQCLPCPFSQLQQPIRRGLGCGTLTRCHPLASLLFPGPHLLEKVMAGLVESGSYLSGTKWTETNEELPELFQWETIFFLLQNALLRCAQMNTTHVILDQFLFIRCISSF